MRHPPPQPKMRAYKSKLAASLNPKPYMLEKIHMANSDDPAAATLAAVEDRRRRFSFGFYPELSRAVLLLARASFW